MILITGAAGQIGKRMARRFLKDGIDFIGVDCVDNPELPQHYFNKMDIRDPSIGEFIKKNGIDSIIHLAFCTRPKTAPKLRDDIDINGSRNIMESAVKNGVSNVVLAGSGRVYGDLSKPGGCHDSDGNYLNPADDDYAQNKIKVENMFQEAGKQHGLKVAILRLAIVCWRGGGVGMGDMFKAASKTGRFFKFGNKNPPIQLVHVHDVIDAFYNAVGKEGIFDVASEGKMTMTDLFLKAAELGSQKPSPFKLPEIPLLWITRLLWKIGLSPIPPVFLKLYGYDITRDISKTERVLGKPRFTVHQVLQDIVEG